MKPDIKLTMTSKIDAAETREDVFQGSSALFVVNDESGFHSGIAGSASTPQVIELLSSATTAVKTALEKMGYKSDIIPELIAMGMAKGITNKPDSEEYRRAKDGE